MIAIIDYGMGNLRSVQKAFEAVGAQTVVTEKAKDIHTADKVVLPGVGAMKPAMDKLEELKLIPVLKKVIEEGKPFLGICLGLQLLFEKSDEGGDIQGLSILKGEVKRFKDSVKVPQMGWNQLHIQQKDSALFKNIDDQTNVYFCHSYFVKPADSSVIATTTSYGDSYASSVATGNIFGVQFHPEKSQSAGLQILKNFMEIK